MSKIILLIVGFIAFVQAAPNAKPCFIPPPPSPAVTAAPVTPIASTVPPPAAAGPAPLTPQQLATLLALYNLYMEYVNSQPPAGAPPALPPPPPPPPPSPPAPAPVT